MNVASRQIRPKIGFVLWDSAERQAAIESLLKLGKPSDVRADWRHDDIKPQHARDLDTLAQRHEMAASSIQTNR